jgi:hypothetical protein
MIPFTAPLYLAPLLLAGADASPWIGTEYVAMVESTLDSGYQGYYYTEAPLVETEAVPISLTVTNPVVLSTYTTELDTYSHEVTAVNLVVEPTAGVEITSYVYMNYYVDVTYTAPSSCSYTTSQTLTTAIPIYPPYRAYPIIEPETVYTSTHTYKYITASYTQTVALLDPSDIPSDVYASASSAYKPAMYTSCSDYYSGSYSSGGDDDGYNDYSGCSEFTWYIGGSAFSGGHCCSDGCHYTWGIAPWGLALAIFFGWFGLFLIIGLIESWFIFRRAMLGQKARRGLPYGFACLCPILSCLTLFTVKKYPPKTPEQQAILATKWKEMSAGSAIGLWLKNFFRRRDPAAVALGIPSGAPNAPYPPPAQGMWYPPPGAPGAPPGMPPMAAYPPPQQGYTYPQGYTPQQAYAPPQAGYPAPSPSLSPIPRGEELDGQPKTVTVSENERT